MRFKLVLAITACSLGLAAQSASSLLVKPTWLAAHLHDRGLVVLEVNGQGPYIPGSQPVTLDALSVSGQLTLELPPLPRLTASLQALGISHDSRVVVYAVDPRQTVAATRILWTLAWYGLGDQSALLDGGLPAWRAAGLPVTASAAKPRAGSLTPHVRPDYFADAAWVSAHLHQPAVKLLDARRSASYASDGHIPGARNLPTEDVLDSQGRLKDPATLAALLQRAGVQPGQNVVSYCYIGERGTLIWLIARLLGHPARLYDGSWEDWSARHLPVEP